MQKEVEKALFDDFHKILDRYYSIIYLMFISGGFIVTVLNITLTNERETIQDVISNYHIILCFLYLILAFLIAISNVLKTSKHKNLVRKSKTIEFREGDELINHNVKLYSTITKLKDFYIIAISLMALSFGAFFNYFANYRVLSILLPFGFIIGLVLTIRESRK